MRRRPGGESLFLPLRCRLPSSPFDCGLQARAPPQSILVRASSCGSGRFKVLKIGGKWKSSTPVELSASSSRGVKAGRRARCEAASSLAACVLVLSASRVRQCWPEESHQGIQAGGVEESLFQAERVRGPMETTAKKRKRERDLLNDPLKHIDLHHAVFSGHTVVRNHSAVAGAAP
uniref:Uncharacterized protein n=1 Tax=Oryza rufipogon TaxID=4529 RepID=A0A0E0Q9D1_ORYRU